MDSEKPIFSKKEVTEAVLARGTALLHLDPRRPGVDIPRWLNGQPHLVLQIGYDMPIPIPDLWVDERGVSATLSFNRSPYACVVPWEAIFAVVDDNGRGMVWREDLPVEIAAEVEREMRRAKIKEVGAESPVETQVGEPYIPHPGPLPQGEREKRGALAPTEEPPPGSQPSATKGKIRTLPPYLRVIK